MGLIQNEEKPITPERRIAQLEETLVLLIWMLDSEPALDTMNILGLLPPADLARIGALVEERFGPQPPSTKEKLPSGHWQCDCCEKWFGAAMARYEDGDGDTECWSCAEGLNNVPDGTGP